MAQPVPLMATTTGTTTSTVTTSTATTMSPNPTSKTSDTATSASTTPSLPAPTSPTFVLLCLFRDQLTCGNWSSSLPSNFTPTCKTAPQNICIFSTISGIYITVASHVDATSGVTNYTIVGSFSPICNGTAFVLTPTERECLPVLVSHHDFNFSLILLFLFVVFTSFILDPLSCGHFVGLI